VGVGDAVASCEALPVEPVDPPHPVSAITTNADIPTLCSANFFTLFPPLGLLFQPGDSQSR
jgi:hypothetical protein